MSLVYDMSEASQKEALVGMLVGTLLEGRRYADCYTYFHAVDVYRYHAYNIIINVYPCIRSKEAVTGDTKLFQEGELGKIPHG